MMLFSGLLHFRARATAKAGAEASSGRPRCLVSAVPLLAWQEYDGRYDARRIGLMHCMMIFVIHCSCATVNLFSTTLLAAQVIISVNMKL